MKAKMLYVVILSFYILCVYVWKAILNYSLTGSMSQYVYFIWESLIITTLWFF